MSIIYSGGTLINSTTVQSTGTRAELADWINGRLVAAGWSSVTNSASDYTLTSATTTQGLAIKVRVYDPGSGNCARLKFTDGTGAKVQTADLFLLPAAAKTWRFVGSKYQFFVMTAPVTAAREFACGGVLYVPTFFSSVTAACWCHGNAISDTDAVANRLGFRVALTTDTANTTVSPTTWCCWNASAWENTATSANSTAGMPRLVSQQGAGSGTGNTNFYRYADGTFRAYESEIGWGLTAVTDEGQVRGQLWDALIVSDSIAGDTTLSYDGHTFIAITHSNAGTSSASNLAARGTLLIAVA